MKNILVMALILTVFVSCMDSKDKRNDLTILDLKGKVKKSKETTHREKINTGVPEIVFKGYTVIKEFNTQGKIVQEDQINPNNTPYSTTINTYDEKGRIIKSDESGQGSRVYEYDKRGNNIFEYAYLEDGTRWLRTTNTFNEKNQKTESLMEIDNIADSPWGSVHYRVRKYTYKYDNKGNLIENLEHHNSIQTSTITYKYDESGREIEEVINSDSKRIYLYDLHGNKITETQYRKDGSIVNVIHNKYEDIDKYGNWRKKSCEFSFSYVDITKREFEFY